MRTCVALLRAVNVAGHKGIAMSDLREWLTQIGMADGKSVLQSGNLVFQTRPQPSATLEGLLEREARNRLGLDTDFFVRTADEWKTLIAANPFPGEAQRDPGHLVVMFLKNAPKADDVAALRTAIVGRETIRALGKQAYVVYPDGIGRSRLTNALIEKKLHTRSTGRNWNTCSNSRRQAHESIDGAALDVSLGHGPTGGRPAGPGSTGRVEPAVRAFSRDR